MAWLGGFGHGCPGLEHDELRPLALPRCGYVDSGYLAYVLGLADVKAD